jgi:coatomer subunit beta'
VYNDFKEHKTFKPFFSAEQIFGGQVLSVRSDEFICLYDWDTCTLIRSIEMAPKAVFWNETGTNVIFAGENSFYVLKYDPDAVKKALTTGNVSEDGVVDSIELETEVNERVKEGQWVGDCFIYTNASKRLNYFIGGQTITLAHLDKTSFFLGYVSKHNRVYLMDKEKNVFSYQLHLALIQYETAIVKGDLEAAEKILKTVPQQFYNQLGRFLHSQGLKEIALQVTLDPEHKFELALELGKLEEAYKILKTAESEHKWRQLGGVALARCDFKLAEECMLNGRDYNGLLLLYTSIGDRKGVENLAKLALQAGINIASLLLLTHVQEKITLHLHVSSYYTKSKIALIYYVKQEEFQKLLSLPDHICLLKYPK